MPADSNAEDVALLKAERTAVLRLLREWTDAFVEAGCPGDFAVNVEGESYDFSDWRAKKLAEVETITRLINQVSSPWIVRTRSR